MSDPFPTNKPAAVVGGVIKAAGGTIVDTAEALAIASQPWLAHPLIKWLWEAAFEWIADKFIRASQTGATFIVIDVQIGAEETDMAKALAAIMAARKSGDAIALKKAIQQFADAQSALAHADGSRPSN